MPPNYCTCAASHSPFRLEPPPPPCERSLALPLYYRQNRPMGVPVWFGGSRIGQAEARLDATQRIRLYLDRMVPLAS